MKEPYRLRQDSGGKIAPGDVVPFNDGVVLQCPCGERDVYVADPPHTITFDDDGQLTLDGSVGSRADQSRNRPANWCHFWIRRGRPEMCNDAKCPGGNQ